MKRLMSRAALLALAIAVAQTAARADEAVKVDPKLPTYKKVEGISGNLSAIGSDTMNNLMTLWAEGFKKFYPGVSIQVEGKGSSTAPPALIEGTAQFGPMSRDIFIGRHFRSPASPTLLPSGPAHRSAPAPRRWRHQGCGSS